MEREESQRVTILPTRMGGLRLRYATRCAEAACWASWAEALHMVGQRNPEVAEMVVLTVSQREPPPAAFGRSRSSGCAALPWVISTASWLHERWRSRLPDKQKEATGPFPCALITMPGCECVAQSPDIDPATTVLRTIPCRETKMLEGLLEKEDGERVG